MNKELKKGDTLYMVDYIYGELDPEKLLIPFCLDKVNVKGNYVFAHVQNWKWPLYSPYICGHKNGFYMTGQGRATLYPKEQAKNIAITQIRAFLYERILSGIEKLEEAGFNVQLSPKQQ